MHCSKCVNFWGPRTLDPPTHTSLPPLLQNPGGATVVRGSASPTSSPYLRPPACSFAPFRQHAHSSALLSPALDSPIPPRANCSRRPAYIILLLSRPSSTDRVIHPRSVRRLRLPYYRWTLASADFTRSLTGVSSPSCLEGPSLLFPVSYTHLTLPTIYSV